MAVKFSAFTTRTGTLDASTKIVGYDDPAGTKTNVEFSLATLAANSGIYGADGTIGTTRKALITDTIQFRNAGDTSDVFSLNTDGTFSLGLGATSGGDRSVAIGNSATAYETGNEGSIAIGHGATTTDKYGVAIGTFNTEADLRAIAIGTATTATTEGSIAIGYDVDTTGAGGITLASNFLGVVNNTANAFGVYMTSTSTPDFEVVGGGTSTLNTSLDVISSTTNYNGVVAKFGNVTSPTNRNTNHVFYTQGQSGGYAHIAQGQMGTGRIFLHGYGFSSIYGMMLKANQDNYLIIGPQTSSTDGDETLRVTSSGLSVGVGGANTARLHVKGSGTTDATTSLLVEDSAGTDILTVVDDGVVKINGQGYTEFYDTANTTLTVNWNNSNIQELTGLTGSHTFTASNPKAGATYILTLAQTGAVTATWTGVKWPGGTAPTLSGTGKTDVVTLICYDATGAGLYYGSATLDLA